MHHRANFRAACGISLLLLSPLNSRADDRISMPVKINGHTLQLAFDTGTGTDLIVWQTVAEKLKLAVEAPPADFKPQPGEAVLSLTEPAKVEIFGKTFDHIRLAVLEVPPYLAPEISGVVGWPAFRESLFALKVAEGTIADVDRVPRGSDGWVKFPLRKDANVMLLELPKQAGGSDTVLVDTGSSDGVKLSLEKWREWKAAHPRQPVTLSAYFTPGAGLVVREEVWADELAFGQLVLRGVAIMEASVADVSSGSGYTATFGLGALRRVDVVIDGKQNAAYAKPRRDPPAPYEHNRLGAVFVPPGGDSDALVAHVAPGSPAAAGDIRDGDVLLKIDALDVTPWRTQPGILPLSRFWTQPAGTKLVLTFRRGATTLKATVTLKNILGPEAR